jgi:hypothetical protein
MRVTIQEAAVPQYLAYLKSNIYYQGMFHDIQRIKKAMNAPARGAEALRT